MNTAWAEECEMLISISDDEGCYDQDGDDSDEAPGSVERGHEMVPATSSTSPPAQSRKRCRSPSIEKDVASDCSHCSFVFEDDGHEDYEDFIPRGARRASHDFDVANVSRSALGDGITRPAPVCMLPASLRALLPHGNLAAPRELAAVEHLTSSQSKAVQHVAQQARSQSEAAFGPLAARLQRYGYGPGTLEQVLAYIRNDAPIIVHIDLKTRLEKLSKDTHYRNQFETGSTCGSSDLAKRRSWEDRLFQNIYVSTVAAERVKYGVLNAVNDPCGIATVAKQYGLDYIVLRGVRLRATFSDRDSCNKGNLATCEWYAHVLAQYSDIELRAVAEVALGERSFVDSAVLETSQGGYKEVQIHGALVLDQHVDAVVVHHSRRGTQLEAAVQAWCTAIGARLEWMPCGDDSQGQARTMKLAAETPLWCWRPSSVDDVPWLHFDAFASAVIQDAQHSGNHDLLPSLPVGNVASIDYDNMSAIAHIGGVDVRLDLQRRTAGEGARKRAATAVGSASSKLASWEWCAAASGHGQWCAYQAQPAAVLEQAFQRQLQRTELIIEKSTYDVDLELMVQVNRRTGYRRLVRRTFIAPKVAPSVCDTPSVVPPGARKKTTKGAARERSR